jgi:hypothetical protein
MMQIQNTEVELQIQNVEVEDVEEIQVENEADNIWIPSEVLRKLRNLAMENVVISAGLFCIINSTTEVMVQQAGRILIQNPSTFFAFPASVFVTGVGVNSAVKGVSKSIKKIKNVKNESKAEECSYSVYLATSTLDGIDKNEYAKVIRKCYKTVGQVLTLKQKLHRVDHWKLVFESKNDDDSCYTIELKDNDGKIKCCFNKFDKYTYNNIRINDTKSTYFYLCGFNEPEEDALYYALHSFERNGHPMNNQNYGISNNNCQHYTARILYDLMNKEKFNFKSCFEYKSTLVDEMFKVINVDKNGEITNLNRFSIYITKFLLKDSGDVKSSIADDKSI